MFKLIVALCLLSVSYAAVGGWKNMNANDASVSGLAQIAVAHLNEKDSGIYYRGLVEVKSAKQQVVKGLKYELTIVSGETHCVKSDSGANLCEIPSNAAKQECVFTLWKEPAAEVASVLSYSCADI